MPNLKIQKLKFDKIIASFRLRFKQTCHDSFHTFKVFNLISDIPMFATFSQP